MRGASASHAIHARLQPRRIPIPAPQEQTMSVERIANPLRTAGHPAMRLWSTAVDAMERRRAARLVGEMDDRMLSDIGIQRGDAERAIRHGREHVERALPWWGR